MAPPPSVAPIGPASNGGTGGDGHHVDDNQVHTAISATIAELAQLQRRRRFAITQANRADRAIESMIASTLGFRIDAEKADRKKVFAAAMAHRLAVEKGIEGRTTSDTQRDGTLSAISPLILASAANRSVWDDMRTGAEKEMRRLATLLPTHPFAQAVKGFGDLAHAALQAEAGIPFGEYRTVSCLWKRMGLAVVGGRRQRRVKGDGSTEQGYSPKRRAEVWAFLSNSMFRHQRHGPYGEVYDRRRANTESRIGATADLPKADPEKWTKGRCHADACRVMSKALLRDLWRASRGLPPLGAGVRTDG